MSEIITVHVGGSGTRVGLSFWQQLTQTKKANLSTQGYSDSDFYYRKFYAESLKGDDIPRSIFFDTDLRSKQLVSKSHLKFDPKNSIGKNSSCCGLFAQGLYIEGADLVQELVEKVRKEAEQCDLLSGFIITQSPAGGAGSGMGANVLAKLREHYCDRMVEDVKILPGPDVKFSLAHLNPLQVYNIVLSTHYAIENTDLIYCLENNAAFGLLARKGSTHTSYDQVNKYFGHCLNEHIHPYLQPGPLNSNQRKRGTNLVLFPRIKHLCGSLSDSGTKTYLESALNAKNRLMILPSPSDQRIYSAALHIRDTWASQNQVWRVMQEWGTRTSNRFVEWLPCNYSLSLGRPNPKSGEGAWVLLNATQNIQWLKKLTEHFTAQIRRRAFLSHYLALGMDDMEFTEAESNCNDLISEYIPYQNYFMDEDEFYNQQQQYN